MHTQPSQAYKYEWSIWNNARHNIKRERVNRSSANNKICFKVRAPSSTSPPSHRRISTPLACPHRTPTKGTSTEDLGQYNHKEYPTPFLTNTTSSLRHNSKPTNNHLTTWGKSTQLHKDHLTTWGIQPKCTTSSTQWGKGTKPSKYWVYNLVIKRPQTISFPTQRSYRIR